MWSVTTLFYALARIKDGRWLPIRDGPELEILIYFRKTIAESYNTLSPDVPAGFEYRWILAIQALQHIDVSERLNCHYSSSSKSNFYLVQLPGV